MNKNYFQYKSLTKSNDEVSLHKNETDICWLCQTQQLIDSGLAFNE